MTLSEKLLEEVDSSRGFVGRSEFIRQAIAEKLDLDESFSAAPDRAGVGGRPSHKKVLAEEDALSKKPKRRTVDYRDSRETPTMMVAEDAPVIGLVEPAVTAADLSNLETGDEDLKKG